MLVKDTEQIIREIIGASFEVYNTLGSGFLETVFQHGVAHELQCNDVNVEVEKPIRVYYKGKEIGFYKADILAEGHIIVECKCVVAVTLPHINQVKNYLKATGLLHGLIVNFGSKGVDVKRVFV